MVRRWGAAEAARRLLVNGDIQGGFRRLVQSGKPELTVEWSALGTVGVVVPEEARPAARRSRLMPL